jgi:putative hemolysin
MTRAAMEAERCLAIFPAGRLARRTAQGRLEDKSWMPTALSVAQKYRAPVLPVHVDGPWATLFHFFDKFSAELRDITLFHELLNKKKAAFQLKVGKAIPPARLDIDAARATAGLKTFTERVLPEQPNADFA